MSQSMVRICRYACVVLMAVLLVLQFTPYWQVEGETPISASISDYIWFPTDNTDLDKWVTEQAGEGYALNQIVIFPILVLAGCFFGILMMLWKRDSSIWGLIPAICCGVALIGWLVNPALQLGSLWGLHALLMVAIVVLAVITLLPAKVGSADSHLRQVGSADSHLRQAER